MELRQLESFCKVVECGGFSKAALQRHLLQPTLSLHVKALEDELNVKLFERIGRKKLVITEGGRILYDSAKKIFHILEETKQKLSTQNAIKGILKVASGVIVGENIMPPLLGAFKQKYPQVQVNLYIFDTQEIINCLTVEHSIDCGIIGAHIEHKNVVLEEFMQEELVVIIPKEHRWSKLRSTTVHELIKEPMVMREWGSGTRMTLENKLRELGYSKKDLNIVMELGSTAAVKQAVMANIGIAIVNKTAVKKEIELGLLKEMPVENFSLTKHFYLVYPKRKVLPIVLVKFLKFLKEYRQNGGYVNQEPSEEKLSRTAL